MSCSVRMLSRNVQSGRRCDMPDVRFCADCDEHRPVSEFHTNKASRSGYQTFCKFHMTLRQGIVVSYIPKWGVKYCPRCDKFLAFAAFAAAKGTRTGLQAKCRDCHKAMRPSKDEAAAYQRKRRANDLQAAESSRSNCRRYHAEHKEERIAKMRDYRAQNPDVVRAAVKAWAKRNPEKVLVFNQTRRCRKKAAEGSFTAAEWLTKQAEYNHKCAYCRKDKKLTVHHVVPLARGGSNWISNIAPACRSCNSSIGTKIVVPEVPKT